MIVIVGAGPVGLTAAVALHQAGIPVQVLEKRPGLSRASMASTFHPATLTLLHRLGAWTPGAGGVVVPTVDYWDYDAGRIAALDLALLAGETAFSYRVHLEQAELTPRLLALLPPGTVCFDRPVMGLAQDVDGVTLAVAGKPPVRAHAVIAADGARSVVRDMLGIAFDGDDYDSRILRLMTAADLRAHLPGVAGLSYVYRGGASCSLLEMADCWRLIFRVPAATGDDAALDPAWHRDLIARHLPLDPAALGETRADIFAVGKRVADRFAEGRVLLAGDAAHVTNTRGGMNMNAGIHDAWTLARALAAGGIEAARPAAAARRRVAVEQLLPRTDRTVAPGAGWRAHIEALAADPIRTRAYLREACMLDMVDL